MRYWHLAIPSAMTPRLTSVPLEQTSVAQWSWGFPDVRWCSISWVDPNFRCRFGVVKNMMFLCQLRCSVSTWSTIESSAVNRISSGWPPRGRRNGKSIHLGHQFSKRLRKARHSAACHGWPLMATFLPKKRGYKPNKYSLWMFRKSKINHNQSNPRSSCPAAKIPHWCIIIFVPLR